MGNKKWNQKTVLFVMSLVIFLIIGAVICADFMMQTKYNTNKIAGETAKKEMNGKAATVQHALEDQFSDLKTLAAVVAEYTELNDERLLSLLSEFGMRHFNSRVAVADLDGNCYSKELAAASVLEYGYFQEVVKNKSDVVSQVVTGEGSENQIFLCVPVFRDSKLKAVLLNSYTNDALIKMLNLDQPEVQEKTYLVQADGKLVMGTGGAETGQEYLSVFPKEIAEKEGPDIENKRKELKSGSFRFRKNDISYDCSYEPVLGYDWYIFAVSSVEHLNDYTEKSTMIGMTLMIKMGVLLLSGMGIVLYWIVKGRKNIIQISEVMENVTNHAPGGMIRFCLDDMRLTFVNESFYRMTGCSPRGFQEKYHNDFSRIIDEPDRERVLSKIRENRLQGKEYKMRYRLKTGTDQSYWVQQVNNVYQENGNLIVYGIIVDIAEYKSSEDELFLSNQRYKIIVNQMESCFIEFDVKSMQIVEEENFTVMFGRKLEEGKDVSFVYEEDRRTVEERFQSIIEGRADYAECEVRIQNKEGSYLWCLIRFYSLMDESGGLSRLICKLTNIDKRKRLTAELENRAMQDPLTGLYNKMVTEEKIVSYLLDEPEDIQAVFIVDLDNFKEINDHYGHAAGDKTIRIMAKTLKSLFRKSDVTGRIGGDEFLICMKNCRDEEYALKKAKQIAADFILMAKEEGIEVSCSIGAALYPGNGRTYPELFKEADRALYQAKRTGKNKVAVSEQINK